MRLTGFQSGLDINQMVSDLMKAQRIPMNKLTQQKQILEWKRDDYREVNRLLNDFSNLSFNMTLQSTYSQKLVSSTNDKISATASSSAANVSYTISDVKVATVATNSSSNSILQNGEKLNLSESLWEQRTKLSGNLESSDYGFTIKTYNQAGDEVSRDFTFDETTNMNDIISSINSSDLGVTAFYDEFKGGLVITKREAGDFNFQGKEIQFEGDFLANVMKMDQVNEIGGTPAKLTINGVETERNSNSFTINGVTFNLKEDMIGQSSVINVTNDTDKTFNAVKDYLTKYNELIEKINVKLSEPLFRDYKPLSKDERESLSERQIEQWEEKAKSGLLRNDSILTSGLSKMRSSLYEAIPGLSGAFSQLSQIGVTSSSDYRDRGKLVINDEKLRAAITEDPNSVMQLFSANGNEGSGIGIARKLRDTARTTINSIEARAGTAARTSDQFTIGRELKNVDQRISAFEKRMQTVEARYWRQFTAMEKAIGQSNQQSMQLMSQFFNG
ncbi:flagellar hook-associated protein 2 [Sutcliffiella horikoshii]|uniref:flagellar hook-associated protein 2 n=1 Tax=Sutcliffiella horikoshii TaxID=79883 RepID=UPI00203F9802|nr:flagellar hook-associated protein 2 [Sutcliffiella horikoshii]MCM3618779.1 flagellar hook-associated protein 2 [Sutcliffiella horikoshii]